MTNPFESATSPYLVLVNDEDQHSLWPASADIPSGWAVSFGAASRADCLEHITTTWTDMSPRSLRSPSSVGIGSLTLDHARLFVESADETTEDLVRHYGFDVLGREREPAACDSYSVAVGRGDIRLVLTEPVVEDHPARAYLQSHGSGVADIAFRVPDAASALRVAVERGAEELAGPQRRDGFVTATIHGFGGLRHTFVQHPEPAGRWGLPEFGPSAGASAVVTDRPVLGAIDHFAVLVEAGQLEAAVDFYRSVLDFSVIFGERTVVGSQAMNSSVVQSASGTVTLTLIEPDVTREPGQIDEFLKNHGGPGVQHVAFSTDGIVAMVEGMRADGVEFLSVPDRYYDQLGERIAAVGHDVGDLRRLNILVDEDHDGQLFQIFTRSRHPRGTLFFEIIERMGARTFGSGNIKALYSALESERAGA